MAALRWLVVSICGLGAVGLAGLGIDKSLGLRAGEGEVAVAPKVAMRPMPATFVPGAVKPPSEPSAETANDAGVAAETAVVDAGAPPIEAAAPAPKPAPAPTAAAPKPAAPAAGGEGLLTLRASDTADVFVDGKRVGSAPVLNFKAKAGVHKVRFDCYDAAGNTVAGAVQTVTASAETPVDITFTCPPSE